jgi:hypothetical protein
MIDEDKRRQTHEFAALTFHSGHDLSALAALSTPHILAESLLTLRISKAAYLSVAAQPTRHGDGFTRTNKGHVSILKISAIGALRRVSRV